MVLCFACAAPVFPSPPRRGVCVLSRRLRVPHGSSRPRRAAAAAAARPRAPRALASGSGASADADAEWEEALSDVGPRAGNESQLKLPAMNTDLSQFVAWLQKGRLNLFPAYQRNFIWKPERFSRLITTVLSGRYIPPVVLHERKDGVYDVVDGKQRLTSVLGFMLNSAEFDIRLMDEEYRPQLEEVLPRLKQLAKLDDSYENLNGLTFDALSKVRRRRFESYSMCYVIIPNTTSTSDVFEVYDDINSGAEDLTPQQLRRAVFYGPYIELLDRIAELCVDFHAIRDTDFDGEKKYLSCPKHSDRELVLRAFAFRENGGQFKKPLKKFLNLELEGTSFEELRVAKQGRQAELRLQKKLKVREEEFFAVMKVARAVFGGNAFHKWAPPTMVQRRNSEEGYSYNKTLVGGLLWDAKYCALAELLKEFPPVRFTEAGDGISDALKGIYESGVHDLTTISAKNFLSLKDEFKTRFREAIARESHSRDDQRAFRPELRAQLYDVQEGKCAICGQGIEERRIDDGQYVHIDHKTPHSRGGATANDNAQLAHAVCNRKKGASPYTAV